MHMHMHMRVRACSRVPIAPGEELCFSYLAPDQLRSTSFLMRNRDLDFECACPRCGADRESAEDEACWECDGCGEEILEDEERFHSTVLPADAFCLCTKDCAPHPHPLKRVPPPAKAVDGAQRAIRAALGCMQRGDFGRALNLWCEEARSIALGGIPFDESLCRNALQASDAPRDGSP